MKRVAYVALLVLVSAIAFVLGYGAHRNEWIPQSLRDAVRARLPGRQPDTVRPFKGDAFPLRHHTAALDAESISALNAMGYAAGTQPATARHGVTIHEPSAAFEGLNLYTSGHAPEAILMEMDGTVVHRWRCPFDVAFPGYVPPTYVRDAARVSWRRARLLSDGSLLVIFEGMALVKLDAESRVLWS